MRSGTTGFSALNSKWENGRLRGLTGRTTALWERSAQSDSLVAGEELVTLSKVRSDLAQLEIRTRRELRVHTFIKRFHMM